MISLDGSAKPERTSLADKSLYMTPNGRPTQSPVRRGARAQCRDAHRCITRLECVEIGTGYIMDAEGCCGRSIAVFVFPERRTHDSRHRQRTYAKHLAFTLLVLLLFGTAFTGGLGFLWHKNEQLEQEKIHMLEKQLAVSDRERILTEREVELHVLFY